MLFKALKTGFVENKGQSGPLSVVSKTQGKCQLSVKFQAICQLSVKVLAICWLSVNPIQTLYYTIKRCIPKTRIHHGKKKNVTESYIVPLFLSHNVIKCAFLGNLRLSNKSFVL